jgi:hypothetical protein
MKKQPKKQMTLNQQIKTSMSLAAAMGSLALATANGASIFDDLSNELADPSITTSETAHSGSFLADNVFDGIVATASGQYATGNPTNSAADAFIDFDFTTATTIGGFVFYQRDSGNDQVTDFDLIFSNNADFTAPVATLNFATTGTPDFTLVADPTGTPTRQEFEFVSSVNARYVKWEVNASASIYDGAAEMEFWAPVPEPSSAALLGLGGLALIFRRRK